MKTHKVGIIMNGVTGRMGTNQHLMRSIVEIIKQGGVWVNPEETLGDATERKGETQITRLQTMSNIE